MIYFCDKITHCFKSNCCPTDAQGKLRDHCTEDDFITAKMSKVTQTWGGTLRPMGFDGFKCIHMHFLYNVKSNHIIIVN